MREAGFDDWNEEKLNSWRDFAFPDGIFVVEYIPDIKIVAAALSRFAQAGYRRIYLKTDDRRLPPIKTYLKLRFRPYLYADGMQERWLPVFEKLQMLPSPGNWEKV